MNFIQTILTILSCIIGSSCPGDLAPKYAKAPWPEQTLHAEKINYISLDKISSITSSSADDKGLKGTDWNKNMIRDDMEALSFKLSNDDKVRSSLMALAKAYERVGKNTHPDSEHTISVIHENKLDVMNCLTNQVGSDEILEYLLTRMQYGYANNKKRREAVAYFNHESLIPEISPNEDSCNMVISKWLGG